MRRNKQLIVDADRGDCHRACVTSILGIANDPKYLPDASASDSYLRYDRFLRRFGLEMVYEQEAFWRRGYWIASVKSLNYEGVTHSIVMHGSRVAFDPSTKKRYKSGTEMLANDNVVGGFFLEVTDASKLHNLCKFRERHK